MEKLIDEWVAAIKIAATTLELDKENFIKLVELSLEGSVKIGWDNTPADTKASILARDSKSEIADRLGRLIKIHFIGDGYLEGSRTEKAREYAQALFSLELRSICAVDEYIYWFRKYFFQSGVAVDVAAPMFFAKICSPWREMLIQSYKVPEGQMDSVARRMSFLKDKLKDWCYQASIQKNMKRLREELLLGEDHGGPKPKPEHTNLGNGVDQQGLHPKDLDEQRQDPQEEPLPEELSDRPIPGRMKVSKIATARHVEQEDISLQIARRNVNDGFRIGGISKVLNQIGLNQRKHHIIYKVSSGEFAIPMEFTGNVMEMQLIPKEEILEELSRLKEEIAVTMKWIHIGTIEVVIKATFKEGIDSEIHLSIMDRRINNLRDGCLGTMKGNLYAGKLMFDIRPRIAYNLADQDFSRVLTLHQDFKRKDLMREGNRPYSITYRIAYSLSNTHHSDLFLRKEYIEIPRIFKEFAKVMAPDPIRIPRIGGVDIVIKDHPVLDRTMSSRIEYGSRMSFSEDRIIGYEGKEKDLARVLTPQEIRVDNVKLKCPEGWKEMQVIFDITKNENFFPCDDLYHLQQPVVGRYEGMLEIAGHEFLVAGDAGRENGSMTLGLSFLEDHKPWGRKGNGMEFSLDGVLRREKAFNRIMPINFRSKRGNRDSSIAIAFEESEEEIKNLKEAMQELKIMDISEESMLSLENVKRLIQRNFSENPLAWWDRNKIEATLKIKEECKYEYVRYKPIQMNMEDKKDMQIIIKEHINLGLIEPGISAYSSPRFLIKMESESKKFTAFSTPQGIFIKDLAKYRKDFRPLLKETESARWKWEEIHTQRVRELKQVYNCNILTR
ncbi:movement protein [Sesamum angolense]|uniref:Movement protein n=1 Tax=Sesamum angolense TaxID=2727404 RepID=A0AAE1T4V0_9LAMI|nr:movement protein [Sesamum angolense]